jgi:hypothetical protein
VFQDEDEDEPPQFLRKRAKIERNGVEVIKELKSKSMLLERVVDGSYETSR